jgi:hypothetical protein
VSAQAGLAPPSPSQDQSSQPPSDNPPQPASDQHQPDIDSAREQLRSSQRAKFSKKSHTRLQPLSSSTQSPKDTAECALIETEFDRLQCLSGKNFDVDAFSDVKGDNAHCKDFFSKDCSFLTADVTGKHVWMFPPPDQVLVKDAVDHMVDCWRKDPEHTSACILLPKGFSHLTNGTDGRLRLIHTYAKGAKIWQSPNKEDPSKPSKTIKTTCVLHVYMLDPMSPQAVLGAIQAKTSNTQPTTHPIMWICSRN